MGYTTEFSGSIRIEPPLSEPEIKYLAAFSDTRRMDRANGPFYLGAGMPGQAREADIRDYNSPPQGQPGLWCQWIPSDDGGEILWNGGEKFYSSAEWMSYLRSYFIVHRAAATLEPGNFSFLQNHRMSGLIHAVGEGATDDVWRLKADDEGIFVSAGAWTHKALREGFNQKPEAEEDGDESDWDDYVGAREAIEFVERPAFVDWGPWERIPDFATPAEEALLMSSKERDALNQAAALPDASKSTPSPSI